MKDSFIKEVLVDVLSQPTTPIDQITFILPSKRAGGFLKHQLKALVEQTTFSPKVLSIEDFIIEVTQLKSLDNTNSLFQFYETYTSLTPTEEKEEFDTFYAWAQTLIYDFNEIDRYLISPQDFFSYLSQIQDINHWSVQQEQTELIKNYLKFWHKLPEYYQHFTKQLLQENKAYQGLIYRKAAEKIEEYLEDHEGRFIFIGFNALNNAEQKIIQTVLEQKKGSVFWDIDSTFFEDSMHDAGLFMRDYKKNWSVFSEQDHDFKWLTNHYKAQKEIDIYGVPKHIGQAKQVGSLLKKLSKEELSKTALVLNDEALLLPILNSLPSNVDQVNITMGLPLGETPLASLFESLFKIQEETSDLYYYKPVLEILNHPFMVQKLGETSVVIQQKIAEENLVFISLEKILNLAAREHAALLSYCFTYYKQDVEKFLEALTQITTLLQYEQPSQFPLETEYLFHFNKLFKKLQNLLAQHNPIKNCQALYRIYKDSLGTESLDFSGSPFEGLQLMGMLETRVLDYERIIVCSVNEGLLPAGKSNNSFIPYDLKKAYNLPTYKEKDAVYAYHFYRLLQRANHTHLLYNNDQTGFQAGEPSRFITQLKIEKQPAHQLNFHHINPSVQSTKIELKEIKKTPEILDKLKKLAEHGFSPSALSTYIRNPLDFYKKYVLGIREADEVEESVAANTLGTVVHDTLEYFYKTFEGKKIGETDLKKMKASVAEQVHKEFQKTYKQAPISHGKNLLVFEIAKRYVTNFLQEELQLIQQHELQIVQVENKLKALFRVEALDFPIYISGKVDRVDLLDETLRIIDYKTGKVEQTDLNVKDWEELTQEYKFSKAFQVLCYAYMIHQETPINKAQAGIISFKNLKKSYLKFTDYEDQKNQLIDEKILLKFRQQLERLLIEIFDPAIPFTEKEV
ncbi:PD-(D/E)XK nuclease family protein [Mesonia aquimarina]|uniref:PD-(D/E)XK nuclease family protein n=1 Tax=Mesonia aquimarina TaxID=1504967 RepID=UPI000EF60642|nr:PD-(D/E)XK nuclease family protein [Mesonia aquimarina]